VRACLVFIVLIVAAGCIPPRVPERVLHREQRRVEELTRETKAAAAIQRQLELALVVSGCAVSVLIAVTIWRAVQRKGG